MKRAINLEDVRCTACGAAAVRGVLREEGDNNTELCFRSDEIQRGAIQCLECRMQYDVIWGAPFLGGFDREDVVGLIEIAANARTDNGSIDIATIERLERLLAEYHEAPDRAQLVRDHPDEFVRADWFSNRYTEWLQFKLLTSELSFSGRRVLDVGAGIGTDTYRIFAAGAIVTALEYNPMLVRRGMEALPGVRWIGGLSHALPFISESFDIVCCNAALHHMRDVATSLEEMLRMLKPGGWLITTGDPYRARHLGADHELKVFNRHPGVLAGINESIPSFTAFETVLARHRSKIQPRILTGELHQSSRGYRGLPALAARTIDKIRRGAQRFFPAGAASAQDQAALPGGMRWWDFDRDRRTLGNSSGSIGLRCRVQESMQLPARLQKQVVLRAGDYAETFTDYQRTIQHLAQYVPDCHVDNPFPGDTQTKFALLNGWLAPDGSTARKAFKRARWFLRKHNGMDWLKVTVRYPAAVSAGPASLDVLVSGIRRTTLAEMSSNWHQIVVPMPHIPDGAIFVVEFHLNANSRIFDEDLFEVRSREFSPAAQFAPQSAAV